MPSAPMHKSRTLNLDYFYSSIEINGLSYIFQLKTRYFIILDTRTHHCQYFFSFKTLCTAGLVITSHSEIIQAFNSPPERLPYLYIFPHKSDFAQIYQTPPPKKHNNNNFKTNWTITCLLFNSRSKHACYMCPFLKESLHKAHTKIKHTLANMFYDYRWRNPEQSMKNTLSF